MSISREIGWNDKANMLYKVLKKTERLVQVASSVVIQNNNNIIINVINGITGESDTTYEEALSQLVIDYGGTGTGSIIDMLNELNVILGGSDSFINELDVLNDIDILLGGLGNWTNNVDAWISLGTLLNPLPPENAIKFEGTDDYIFFENDETEQFITFEITV